MSEKQKAAVILVVDDELHQLETIRRGLFLYGYESRGASNADEALAVLTGPERGSFDLVLTDLTMPGRSGIELIEQIQLRMPTLPIIVITGLAATKEIEWVQQRGLPILQKPFEPDGLHRLVSDQLENK
ncbi:MAG: response regulator [Myxococcota bacterium]|nr:response regulator [Myxococcota bacterium]